MILYFTGTGNSRFLAEIIAKQLKDELVDATEHIQLFSHINPMFLWHRLMLGDCHAFLRHGFKNVSFQAIKRLILY